MVFCQVCAANKTQMTHPLFILSSHYQCKVKELNKIAFLDPFRMRQGILSDKLYSRKCPG